MAHDALAQAQRAFSEGDVERARHLAEAVLATNERSISALALLANAANALRDYAAAAAAIERLRELRPQDAGLRSAHATALNNSGSSFYHAGKLDAAMVWYRRALELEPDNLLALTNLAACAERTRAYDEAARCYARLVRLEPTSVAAPLGQSRSLRAQAAHRAADATLHEAERRAGSDAERCSVGREYLRSGDADAAARLFRAAAKVEDGTLEDIARMQAQCNDATGARTSYARLARHAESLGDERRRFRAERDRAVLLPQVPGDGQALAHARAHYCAAVDHLIGDWPPQRLRDAGVMLDDLACSRFRLAYQGSHDRAIAERYGDWLAAAGGMLVPQPITGSRRGRIGMVSARWNQGTVAAYFGSWIGALRAAGNEVYFYSTSEREDAVSAALGAQANQAHRLPRPLAAAAACLREADLDLLIYPEVGLDAATEVLAALRLAPRQWTAWGHPVTTGLPTIDRFLGVAAMEPPDAVDHYREPLALLPGLGTRYARAARIERVARTDLGLPPGPLYALPHAALKLHPDSDALLVAIARLDSDARFVLVEDDIPAITRAYRLRVDAALRAAGVDPARHFVTLPRLPINAFRAMLAGVDVVLDSLYFSGGNTSLDALAQGTPVVTIEGRFMRGRQTAAMLRLLDVRATIADDIAAAASIAANLVQVPQVRREISERIDTNALRLFDDEEPLQALVDLVKGEA